jgi:ferredoxin
MRLRLERSKCAGHALCNGVDPDLFPIDDEGYSILESRTLAPEEVETARAGVECCPELALILEGD